MASRIMHSCARGVLSIDTPDNLSGMAAVSEPSADLLDRALVGMSSLPRMEREAFDLARLQLVVETSNAHPDGVCTREHMTCGGCRLLADIATRYGGPMADYRLCGYAWAVWHDPVHCWQRVDILGRRPTMQGAL